MRTAGFRPGNENHPGAEAVEALRQAFRALGFDLDAAGYLRLCLLENLEGVEVTDALWKYVYRIRQGGGDDALVVGSAKSLEEATARHVIKDLSGTYPMYSDMQTTLNQAYVALDLTPPDRRALNLLDQDARAALQQAVWLLAYAVNRFRNTHGEGHGRPEPSNVGAGEAEIVAQAAALFTQVLLMALDRQ